MLPDFACTTPSGTHGLEHQAAEQLEFKIIFPRFYRAKWLGSPVAGLEEVLTLIQEHLYLRKCPHGLAIMLLYRFPQTGQTVSLVMGRGPKSVEEEPFQP